MTRILFLSLFCPFSAFAQEAAKAEDNPATPSSPEADRALVDAVVSRSELIAARNRAEIEKLESQARWEDAKIDAFRDPTTNGAVIGRAAMTARGVCGFDIDVEAMGRRAVQLAELYPECVRAEAEYLDAQNRGLNANKALDKDIPFAGIGNGQAVGQLPATVLASQNGGWGGGGAWGQQLGATFWQNGQMMAGLQGPGMNSPPPANNQRPAPENSPPPAPPAKTPEELQKEADDAAFSAVGGA